MLCTGAGVRAEDSVNVLALKGPTAMGMVSLMDQADQGEITEENYDFQIVASPDEVSPAIAQGTADIAAVPANLASVLYQKTDGGVQVLTINTLGVLYLVENGDQVQSVSDLKGKTIYASDSLRVALDLTEEWDKIQKNNGGNSSLVTGVTVVRTEFAREYPEIVEDFMERYQESVSYVNEHIEEAAKLIGDYDIVPEEIEKKALPECNIVYIDGAEMKEKLSGYLEVLEQENPQAIGGALPADEFYYDAE